MRKSYQRILKVFLVIVVFIVNGGTAFANPLPSSYNSDSNYYYWDGGLFDWYGTGNYYYETGGSWYDNTPWNPTTLYNNIWPNNEFDGYYENNGLGFSAYKAIWTAGQGAAPTWDTNLGKYTKQAEAWYQRAKTTPTPAGINVSNVQYVNGNDYWVTPGTTATVEPWGHQDYLGGVQRLDDWVDCIDLNVVGNGLNWIGYSDAWGTTSVTNPNTTLLGSSFGPANFGSSNADGYDDFYIQPKQDNMDLDLLTKVFSYNGKTTNFVDTGKWLKTDGTAPYLQWFGATNAPYQNGNTYWVQPKSNVTFKMNIEDDRSGPQMQYLRLSDGTVDFRMDHNNSWAWNDVHVFYYDGANWQYTNSNPDILLDSGGSDTQTQTNQQIEYTITPQTNNHLYDLTYYTEDNVGNTAGYSETGYSLGVDGNAPTVQFRNAGDTADYTSQAWTNNPVSVMLKFGDTQSGYKQSSYEWTQSASTPVNGWSAWSTTNNYNVSVSQSGVWYLHVKADDNVGNEVNTVSGPYQINTPPVAQFSFSPTTIYNNTSVSFNNTSSDADSGQTLTYQWDYQQPGSSTWTTFSTAQNPSNVFNIKGAWNIRLSVSDGLSTTTATQSLTVSNRAPTADFSFSPSTLYNDTPVQFTSNTSDPDGDQLTYNWQYQQPNSTTWTSFSTNQNASMVLNAKGTWNIMLTVTDSSGASVSVTKSPVVVNRAPVASFSFSPSTVFRNTTVTFANGSTDADKDPLTYQWSYRQAGTTAWTNFSTGVSPSQVFSQKGNWEVQLVASDGTDTGSVVEPLTVGNRPPVASFTSSATAVVNNSTVSFTNTSTDPDADPLTYNWEYQQPGSTTWTSFSTATNSSNTFNQIGTWVVRLTATDDSGATTQSTTNIVVSNSAPTADFTMTPNPTDRLTTVSFKDNSNPNGSTLTYNYQYRMKGSTMWVNLSTLASPVFKFTSLGTYEVQLTVTNINGISSSVIKDITVNNLNPTASFTETPSSTDRLTSVQFTSTSTDPEGDALTYLYEYKLSSSSTWTTLDTTASPTFKFPSVGTYDVRLTVTDQYGGTSIATNQVVVNNLAPTANFAVSPTTVYNDTTITFTNTSTDPENDTLTYNWEYQQPGSATWTSFSTTQGATKVLNIKGNWGIRLTVTDSYGATNQIVKNVTVQNRPPVADFTMNPSPTNRLTTVAITSNSSDADGDALTYNYSYRVKGASTWTALSTSPNTSMKFPSVGDYDVQLTVTDTSNASTSVIKTITNQDLAPTAKFTVSSSPVFEGDTISAVNGSTDSENDPLTYSWKVVDPNGSTSTFTTSNLSVSGAIAGTYGITLTVTDSYGASSSTTQSVVVTPLTISATVGHTASWTSIHQNNGDTPDQFYSGEEFVLGSTVSDYPVTSLNVTMSGYNVSSQSVTENTSLTTYTTSNGYRQYSGTLYKTWMTDATTMLKSGPVTFTYVATFNNGVVKSTVVTVNIMDSALKSYDLHRTN